MASIYKQCICVGKLHYIIKIYTCHCSSFASVWNFEQSCWYTCSLNVICMQTAVHLQSNILIWDLAHFRKFLCNGLGILLDRGWQNAQKTRTTSMNPVASSSDQSKKQATFIISEAFSNWLIGLISPEGQPLEMSCIKTYSRHVQPAAQHSSSCGCPLPCATLMVAPHYWVAQPTPGTHLSLSNNITLVGYKDGFSWKQDIERVQMHC